MTPGEFCRIRGYEHAIALTYTFDPLFFERAALRDLHTGGSVDIAVVCEGRQVAPGMASRFQGQLRHLGRSYRLIAREDSRSAMHAKMMLRLGAEGAAVWIGSGNLTHAGWGGNRELYSAWIVRADDAEGAKSVRTLLEHVARLVRPGEEEEAVRRAAELPWLRGATPDFEGRYEWMGLRVDLSLARQLAERWRGRSFKRMLVATGSTDRDGAFLAWALETFGIEDVLVALDPASSLFEPRLLKQNLGGRVRLIPRTEAAQLHAKFVWFEGAEGASAVMGSANCSRSAWLLPPREGGNVELVVVHDEADAKEFGEVLGLFEGGPGLDPAEVAGLGSRVRDELREDRDEERLRLVELSLDRIGGELRAVTNRAVGREAAVVCRIGDEALTLRCRDGTEGTVWAGPLPERQGEVGAGTTVVFASVLVQERGRDEVTLERWMDDLIALAEARRGRRVEVLIRSLSAWGTESGAQQVVEGVRRIAQSIFSDGIGFRDRSGGTAPGGPEAPGHPEGGGKPVELSELIRSLEEIEERSSPGTQGSAGWGWGLPVMGVARALFGSGSSGRDVEEEGEEFPEEGVRGREEHEEREAEVEKERVPPPERLRKRLEKEMGLYLDQLGEGAFAERCTASQLFQALAFPLAVGAHASRGGWVSEEATASWLVRSLARMLHTEYKGQEELGLLRVVRARYEREGRLEVFRRELGQGALWAALWGAIATADGQGSRGGLDRALVLRDVIKEKDLHSGASPKQLPSWLCGLDRVEVRSTLLRDAERAVSRLGRIEEELREKQAEFLRTQYGKSHGREDPLWHPGAGFALAKEESMIARGKNTKVWLRLRDREAKVPSDSYVNVRLAAVASKTLRAELDGLGPCRAGDEGVRFDRGHAAVHRRDRPR